MRMTLPGTYCCLAGLLTVTLGCAYAARAQVAGGPVRPDGVMLTALLLDKDGHVLEVLTGVPDIDERAVPSGTLLTGQTVPFTLSTPIPLGKAVAAAMLYPEALPDAQVDATAQR